MIKLIVVNIAKRVCHKSWPNVDILNLIRLSAVFRLYPFSEGYYVKYYKASFVYLHYIYIFIIINFYLCALYVYL